MSTQYTRRDFIGGVALATVAVYAGQAAAEDGGAPAALTQITLWFNVFIPDRKVGAPPPLGCFLGDNRSFSSSRSVTSRLHAEATVTGLGTSGASLGQNRVWSDMSIKVNCGTDAIEDNGTAKPWGGFRFLGVGTYPDPEGGVQDLPNEFCVALSLETAASDPLIPAPEVGVVLLVIIDPLAGTVRVKGLTDHWPCFDGYASTSNGKVTTLFQLNPSPGTSPYSLVGPRDRPLEKTVVVT